MSARPAPAAGAAETRDVAEAVRFLVSEKARYLTGTEFVIDAGLLTR